MKSQTSSSRLATSAIGQQETVGRLPIRPLELRDTLVYWCEGNHEDHEALAQFAKQDTCQIAPQVCYLPAGSVLFLPDNRSVMFFGGAYPTDRRRPEELPALEEINRRLGGSVDIVISHTEVASVLRTTERQLGETRQNRR